MFDISHNKCRLISYINYRTQKVFILHILIHTEYGKGGWKNDCCVQRPDVLDGIPRVITSEAQNARYTAALLEMERRGNLTAAERNLAEVLTLLI